MGSQSNAGSQNKRVACCRAYDARLFCILCHCCHPLAPWYRTGSQHRFTQACSSAFQIESASDYTENMMQRVCCQRMWIGVW